MLSDVDEEARVRGVFEQRPEWRVVSSSHANICVGICCPSLGHTPRSGAAGARGGMCPVFCGTVLTLTSTWHGGQLSHILAIPFGHHVPRHGFSVRFPGDH